MYRDDEVRHLEDQIERLTDLVGTLMEQLQEKSVLSKTDVLNSLENFEEK